MNSVNQLWYADDAAGVGSQKVAQMVGSDQRKYGYFTNPSKIWLTTMGTATQQQQQADVKVTLEVTPYLGAALGTSWYIQAFMTDIVQR